MKRWRKDVRTPGDMDHTLAALDTALADPLRRSGDVLVNDSSRGLILRSPNGNYWRATIDNAGAVTWTNLGATPPT